MNVIYYHFDHYYCSPFLFAFFQLYFCSNFFQFCFNFINRENVMLFLLLLLLCFWLNKISMVTSHRIGTAYTHAKYGAVYEYNNNWYYVYCLSVLVVGIANCSFYYFISILMHKYQQIHMKFYVFWCHHVLFCVYFMHLEKNA